jgi:opacity protein-like surface antigen
MSSWNEGKLECWKVISLALLSTLPTVLPAQVGHDPGASPYHDLRRGATVRLFTGYFGGGRGHVPVGPADGPTGGVRLEYALGGVLSLTAGAAYAQTDAFFFDPNDSIPQQQGPVDNDLVLADAGLQASLTGGKTYHNLQPYVGATLGLVFGTAIGADTSGYSFGTKFSYGPEAGVRWYPSRRLSVDFGWRLVMYRLRYPLSYRPKLIPPFGALSDGTKHTWATVGVGWTF